ncbi:MAG: hypothetical protein HFH65_07870 [Lachnospiraceae bacterium]|nr:hypothetical protein [Lachnospiraceae bacterium]
MIFIDDNKNLEEINNVRVYKYQEAKELSKDMIEAVIAIGEPEIKSEVYNKLSYDKIDFATLIYPDEYIPKQILLEKEQLLEWLQQYIKIFL